MNIANSVIKTGLLAYGKSGKIFHAPFLESYPGFNLYALVERTQKKAQEDHPTLISYNTIDELLDDNLIELVIINTPNNLHYEHAKAALQKNKHILVEKPFVANIRQAKELFQLADQQKRQIFFYQNRRWDSDFIAVKKVIASGKLGKLNEVHIRFDQYRSAIGPKMFKENPIEASGLQFDLGSHLLDQAISLFGKPISYHKFLGKNRKDTQVDDYFFVQLNYPDSLNITLTASMLVVNPQAAFILHGRYGSFIKPRADVQEDQLLQSISVTDSSFGIEKTEKQGILSIVDKEGGEQRIDYLVPGEKGNYLSLFEAVYQTLINEKEFPITREEILMQIEILEN